MKNFSRIWIFSLVVKLILSALIPLSADEAYYWVWSHKLQLSFFDHPPMVAWLFYLGHVFEPILNAVRWPAVILGHSTVAIWYFIFTDFKVLEKFKYWFWLCLFSPLLGFGSLIVTPDLPVVFFWSLALLFALRSLNTGSLFYYLSLGCTLGLGFCSKYHIVLFIPCLLLFLTFEKKWSKVKLAGVLLTMLGGLIFCFPVLFWNYQNNFASFEFQLKHGLEDDHFQYSWVIGYIISQIILLYPWVLWSGCKKLVLKEMNWLYYFGWGPVLFFLLTAFKAATEANWPIIGYPAILMLTTFDVKITSWIKHYAIFYGSIVLLVLSALAIPNFRKIHDKLEEPFLFEQMSSLVHAKYPVFADSYQLASSLWYFSKVPTFKLREMSRIDYFDTIEDSIPTGNHFYLIKSKSKILPSWLIESKWKKKSEEPINSTYDIVEFELP